MVRAVGIEPTLLSRLNCPRRSMTRTPAGHSGWHRTLIGRNPNDGELITVLRSSGTNKASVKPSWFKPEQDTPGAIFRPMRQRGDMQSLPLGRLKLQLFFSPAQLQLARPANPLRQLRMSHRRFAPAARLQL